MVRLPAPLVPHSASVGPATATRVLSAPVPVSAPPTGLDECFFFIYLVSDFLAVGFSVSSGCARRRSVSTYAAILVLRLSFFIGLMSEETPPQCLCPSTKGAHGSFRATSTVHLCLVRTVSQLLAGRAGHVHSLSLWV